MMGICPNCNIKLKDPPFGEHRETNEMLTTLAYRKLVESGTKIKNIKELGYCEVCKSTEKDLEEQKKIGKN